jgi:hypothetical protein
MRSHGPRRSPIPARSVGRAVAVWLVAAGGALGLVEAGCGTSAPPAPATAAAPAAPAPLAKQPALPPGPPAGAPLRLLPSAEARPLLLASITIPSLDHTLAGAVALVSHAVPLPLDAAGIKESLLTQAGLPPKVGENLDTASPTGVVVVATGGKDVGGLVMAIPAKGVEPARVVIGALGTVVARRGDVVQIDNGSGGRGWVWLNGSTIVLSDSVDALGRGAMLAIDARQGGTGEDLTAVVYPAPIARANGTDVRTALTAAIAVARAARAAQVQEAQAKAKQAQDKAKQSHGKGKATPPAAGEDGVDHSFDVLDDVAGYLADTNTIEIGLVMDEARGLVVNLRVHPLPGTPFEKLTADGKPFTIDPTLLRKPQDIAILAASSYGPFLRGQVARKRQRLLDSHDKGAAGAVEFLDTTFAAMEGAWSGVARLRPTLSVQAVYPLKDEASAAKVSAAFARFDTAVALAFLRSQLAPDQLAWFDVKVRKDALGKLKTLHYTLTIDAKGLAPAGRDAVKKVLGGNALDVYFAVAGTRAVMAAGKDAKARLPELARAPGDAAADKPEHDLSDAMAAAKGKDSFGYFDLGQVIGFVGAVSEDARVKALAGGASAPIPTYVTFANDAQAKQMTFTWTIPPDAFGGAGALLQGLSAAGGGGGP